MLSKFAFPLSYHGYQLIKVGSFRASMEYRVAVTGITASVLPLDKVVNEIHVRVKHRANSQMAKSVRGKSLQQ